MKHLSSVGGSVSPFPGQVDEELSQAKMRLGVCSFVMFYLGAWGVFSGPIPSVMVWAVLGYTLFSMCWFFLVKFRPGKVPWRRLVVIVGDLGVNTFMMHGLQAKGAFFYPLCLWIILANGVRFGVRYLILAQVVGVACFTPVLFFSPYWRANWVAGAGLLFGIIALPIFYLALVRRLHEANERLQLEAARAQAAARAKTEFLANMSHELRTPMSGVLGVAQLMRLTPLSPIQEEYLDLVQRSADSLLRILDDILDFSRIEVGKVVLERAPLDVRAVVEDVVQLLRPRAEEKGLTLELRVSQGGSQAVLGDATRIRQILFNLLGNAVKFTESGHIVLEFAQQALPDGRLQVCFQITDTGMGIPPHQLEQVFEKFERGETRVAQNIGGSGLGLAISRHLARCMAGDVTVSSRLSEGTTFIAILILEASDEPLPVPRRDVSKSAWDFALEALVVEDNPVNLLVTCSLLRRLGISFLSAEDGNAALERWAERSFDLILMDVQLPFLDGMEVTRRIRDQEAEGEHTPILALTANASQADAEACLRAGMDLFLPKPVELAQLEAAIRELAQRGLLHLGHGADSRGREVELR